LGHFPAGTAASFEILTLMRETPFFLLAILESPVYIGKGEGAKSHLRERMLSNAKLLTLLPLVTMGMATTVGQTRLMETPHTENV
jgi:hypothetical protein